MMMKKKLLHRILYLFLSAILLASLNIMIVAAGVVSIDGAFGDWDGNASFVDPGGPDDERSPGRSDITEFRIFSDSGGLYILKAWDDTGFQGGGASAAGVTVRTGDGSYYRVYSTAQGNPGTGQLSDLEITSCADSTCSSQTAVCGGSGCTGAALQGGNTWADPYSGRTNPKCGGPNCDSLDTAHEMFVPWTYLGGAPGDGEMIFLYFGSYPSGPGQAPKDSAGDNGITCINEAGSFSCYPSTPNAITLSDFGASAGMPRSGLWATAITGMVIMAGLSWTLRRQLLSSRD